MLEKGTKIVIQSYKHDESLHRIWANAKVIRHDKDRIIVGNRRTKVIEGNGRFWFTREPSVTWFFKDHWFNIIGIIRESGIYYYCNIASPYVIDDEALKYIDYDLDLKVFPDYTYKVLDRGEYNRHKEKMDYSDEIKHILELELDKLKTLAMERKGPFEPGRVRTLYEEYKKH